MLTGGAILSSATRPGPGLALRQPILEALPHTWDSYVPRDVELSGGEQQVAGMSSYAFRMFTADSAVVGTGPEWFSVYVGYYDRQVRGSTIHSPKNCLPGGGWEAVESRAILVSRPDGRSIRANRYVVQQNDQRALVMYWYQGRGRTESNEYRVKWDLLRDAALSGRTEEALVRIVVPLDTDNPDDARALADSLVGTVAAALEHVLPSWQ
jgi:EpsI family protein